MIRGRATMSAMRSRGVAVLAGVAVVLAIVVAVALVFLFANDREPAASSSAPAVTPEPESTPTTTLVLEPTVPLGGDCTRVLTDEQLDELLGAGWETSSAMRRDTEFPFPPSMETTSMGTLGGLECTWYAGNESEAPMASLSILLLPADGVPPDFAADYATVRCDPSYDALGCRISKVVGDFWVMSGTYILSESESSPPESLERAADHAAATVGSAFDGVAADRQADWATLSTCEELSAEMRLEEVLGAGYVNGYWEGVEQPEGRLLSAAGVGLHCRWFSVDGSAPGGENFIGGSTVASGGAWAWDAIAASESVTPVTVDGAVSAVTVDVGNQNPWLYATDGVNVVTVENVPSSVGIDIAERMLAAIAP
jgi:hypothetical protein